MLISVDWLPPYLCPSRRLLRSRDEDRGLITSPKVTIRDLAFIGLLESRGRGGGSALSRSWDQRRRVRWMRASLGGEERLLARQQTRPNSSTSTVSGPIIARELAEEGISLDHVPGATHMREAN